MFYDTEHERLVECVRARMPADLAAKIVPLIRPTVGFRPDSTGAGLSRLGGRPDLPAQTPWPIGTIINHPNWLDRMMFWRPAAPALFERPHAFVGQIDLSALPAGHLDLPLPDRGLLLVFHDAKEFWPVATAPSWRVLHLEEPGPERPPPPGTAVEFPGTPLAVEAGWTAPPEDFAPPPEHRLSAEDLERYLEAVLEAAEEDEAEAPPVRLGGWPSLVQGGMIQETAQKAAAARGLAGTQAGDWRLVVEVGSVAEAGMNWIDSGSLYFQMTADDVKARRWERAHCEAQTC